VFLAAILTTVFYPLKSFIFENENNCLVLKSLNEPKPVFYDFR
jgi:hypothetical protein